MVSAPWTSMAWLKVQYLQYSPKNFRLSLHGCVTDNIHRCIKKLQSIEIVLSDLIGPFETNSLRYEHPWELNSNRAARKTTKW